MTKRNRNDSENVPKEDITSLSYLKQQQHQDDDHQFASRGSRRLQSSEKQHQQQEQASASSESFSNTNTEKVPFSSTRNNVNTNTTTPSTNASIISTRQKMSQTNTETTTTTTTTTAASTSTSTSTTRVIPADHRLGFPQRIDEFSRKFQLDIYPELKRLYKNAQRSHKTDINGWYQGIRLINGLRYEVQVRGQFMKDTFQNFPDLLVSYAETLALQDNGVQQMGRPTVATTATATATATMTESMSSPISRRRKRRHIFSEWSMIISENCDQQMIHVDVPYDNYQFGLILQGGDESIPGTHVLNNATLGPYTTDDLFTSVWPDAPISLKEKFMLKKSSSTKTTTTTSDLSSTQQKLNNKLLRILEAYGPLLQPKSVLENKMVPAQELTPSKKLHCGDLISTKGGMPHFGPACNKFRMVMFGAVSPSDEDLYNVDDQYFAHTAVLFIIQIVWDSANLESRSFLLHRLADVVSQYDAIVINNHEYLSKDFVVFMNVVAKARHNVRAVDLAIQRFLHTHEKTPESTLFQYRPPRVWNTTTVTSSSKTSYRKRFRKCFDDYQCV